jgi:competence protein ComEC
LNCIVNSEEIGLNRISAVIVIALLYVAIFQVNFQTQTFASSTFSLSMVTSCPENVTVYFLDVGQGDSILVKTSTKNILIDGGPTSAGTTLLSHLSAYNVTKIDLLIATHPHADHIGGLVSVLQANIPIDDIVYNGYNYTSTATFNTWKTLALTHNLTQGNRNQIYSISPSINFTVISPTNPTQFGSTVNEINDNSIVMRLQVGNTSVMLTGDAQFDSEQSMLSSGLDLHSQVLKVGHHGSSTSTSQAFLNAVIPTYSVISAGIDNTFGHPTKQTLDILTNNGIVTYGTYSNGTIIFSLNSASQTPTPTPTPSPILTPSPSTIPTPSTHPTLSSSPTPVPTSAPTSNPTISPTNAPTQNPSIHPTTQPTNNPTQNPTVSPTINPTPNPTPTIPELPSLITIIVLIIVGYIGALTVKKKHINFG